MRRSSSLSAVALRFHPVPPPAWGPVASAAPGEIRTATYIYPKPGSTEPALKSALIGRVKDQICGVGYYAG